MKKFQINKKFDFNKDIKISKYKNICKKLVALNAATLLIGTVIVYTKNVDNIENDAEKNKYIFLDKSNNLEKPIETIIGEAVSDTVEPIKKEETIEKTEEVPAIPVEKPVEKPEEVPTTPVEKPVEEKIEKPNTQQHKKQLAITFDDGPGPYTEGLLDALNEKNAKATFFVVGQNVEKNPELLKEMSESGHQIGNHTYDHINLNNSSIETINNSLNKTDDLIYDATGVHPTVVRPPYGALNTDKLSQLDYSFILWSIDTRDWETRDKLLVKKAILEGAKEGEIILLHDIHKTTVDAVIEVLDELSKEYDLVTVNELFDNELNTNQKYYKLGN